MWITVLTHFQQSQYSWNHSNPMTLNDRELDPLPHLNHQVAACHLFDIFLQLPLRNIKFIF